MTAPSISPVWHAADGAGSSAMLQHCLARHSSGIPPPALAGMRRREGRAIRVRTTAPSAGRASRARGAGRAFARVLLQDGVDAVPSLTVDDGVVLARVALALCTASPI